MSETDESSSKESQPRTFREAEVLGLKFMQERKFEDALEGIEFPMLLMFLFALTDSNVLYRSPSAHDYTHVQLFKKG